MHDRNALVDLNLLVLAEQLFRHRNVSRAARELGLSQSAASHALNRLRAHYGDPLFVRVSRGIAPTELALRLKPEIDALVAKAREISRRLEIFDPRKASGRIAIATTDYFEVVVMPLLLPILQKEAPGLQVSLRHTQGNLPKEELEAGEFQLAIAGFYEDMPEGFFRSGLFRDGFATAGRKNHPALQGKYISLGDFYASGHALVTLQGDFSDRYARTIKGKKQPRHFVYGSASFTGPAWVLAESDLLLTAPRLLLERYGKWFPLLVKDCPVEIQSIDVRMVWHALADQDPLQRWFRERLRQVCRGLGKGS